MSLSLSAYLRLQVGNRRDSRKAETAKIKERKCLFGCHEVTELFRLLHFLTYTYKSREDKGETGCYDSLKVIWLPPLILLNVLGWGWRNHVVALME